MTRRSAKAPIEQRGLNGNLAVHFTICMTILVSAIFYSTELHRALVEWQILHLALLLAALCIGASTFYLANTSNPGFIWQEEEFSITPQGLTARQVEEHYEWCKICLLARPVRAKHCFVCKRCVRRFDHHCPYVGRCIGERNHGYFLVAALVNGGLALYSLMILYPLLPRGNRDGMENLKHSSLLMLAFVLSVIGALGFGMIGIMHFYLVSSGITTWEFVRRKRIRYLREHQYGNPFDEGFFRNIYSVLTQPLRAPRDWSALLPSADIPRGPSDGRVIPIDNPPNETHDITKPDGAIGLEHGSIALQGSVGSSSVGSTSRQKSFRRGAIDVSTPGETRDGRARTVQHALGRSGATGVVQHPTSTVEPAFGGNSTAPADASGGPLPCLSDTGTPVVGGDVASGATSTDDDDFVDVGKEAPMSFRMGARDGR